MNTNQLRPNFVIGGAPKSGTTAMANYLREHSQVFVSTIKEPFYWAFDMPGMRQSTGIDSEQKYLSLFRDATQQHLAIGEASTLYLYSGDAIKEAIHWRPDMKFVFMLRRPAEIAHAYHMQMRFHEFEDIESFVEAWGLRETRALGEGSVPPRCKEPKLICYDSVASIGTQLESAKNLIPDENMLVVLFDDFVSDTGACYRSICKFLGVPDDGRVDFTQENAAMKTRNRHVTRMLRSRVVRSSTDFMKRRLEGKAYAALRKAKHSMMFQNAEREQLPDEFNEQLHRFFIPEVELLEKLLNCDLDSWKRPKVKAQR